MAKQYTELSDELTNFISTQKIYVVATAMAEGHVNLSPKGMDTFRVIAPNRALWLNVTGSGNETAAHVQKDGRMTVMFCAFEGKPMILRLYGTAKVYHHYDEAFTSFVDLFPTLPGTRQIFDLKIELVQTSCGFAVPFMDFVEERTQLKEWAVKQGEERIQNYWKEKNVLSIDGVETNVLGKSID